MSEFKYNNELLIEPADQEAFKHQYPTLGFAFIHPLLCESFPLLDRDALRAKKHFRIAGLTTIALAFWALILAAFEPLFLAPAAESKDIDKGLVLIIAGVASALGIMSFTIGWFGMGLGTRKKLWLQRRLLVERVRQWHWQHMLANLPEIVRAASGSEKMRQDYTRRRDQSFQYFIDSTKSNLAARLDAQTNPNAIQKDLIWVVHEADLQRRQRSVPTFRSAKQEEQFALTCDAIRQVRFTAQTDYTIWTLGVGSMWKHPRTQISRLHSAGHILVASIAVLHALILVGALADESLLTAKPTYFCIITLAIAALGLRAVEDGLRPREQIERLESYLAELNAARERYDDAESADHSARVEAIWLLERAAAHEMRAFITNAHSARYIM